MTASCEIVYWRDIPAQVRARSGRTRASKPLSDRFQVAIDAAAMRAGMSGTDEYLAQWKTVAAGEREAEAEQAAISLVEELEAAYGAERLARLVANEGAGG
jgi:hypothetical protein